MGHYTGNVVMIFSDQPTDNLLDHLTFYYGLTVECVQIVDKATPYPGEMRVPGNTLVHINEPTYIPNGLYSVDDIRRSLDLTDVGLSDELLNRADLVLVQLLDSKDQSYYYPYSNTLYADED